MQIECFSSKPPHKPGRRYALPLWDMAPGDWFETKMNWCRVYGLVHLQYRRTGQRFLLTHGPHLSAHYLGTLTQSNAPDVLVRCECISAQDPRQAIGEPKPKKPKRVKAKDKRAQRSQASIAALKAHRALRRATIRHPDIFA